MSHDQLNEKWEMGEYEMTEEEINKMAWRKNMVCKHSTFEKLKAFGYD